MDVCACRHTCTCVCLSLCVCVHACACVCMRVRVYACVSISRPVRRWRVGEDSEPGLGRVASHSLLITGQGWSLFSTGDPGTPPLFVQEDVGFIHIQARWDRRACCPTVHRAVSSVALPLPPRPPGDVLTSTGRPQALDEEASPGVEAALGTDTNSGPGTHSTREPPHTAAGAPRIGGNSGVP